MASLVVLRYTMSHAFFLTFKTVGIAPTAAIPELSAKALFFAVVPLEDVIVAFTFHWLQGTRTCKKQMQTRWNILLTMIETEWSSGDPGYILASSFKLTE